MSAHSFSMRWLIQAIEVGRAPDLRRVLSAFEATRYAVVLPERVSNTQGDRPNPTLVTTAPQQVTRTMTQGIALYG